MRLGVVGQGSFGVFLTRLLGRYFKTVSVYDKDQRGIKDAYACRDLNELITSSDVVILAVPVSAYEDVLIQLGSQGGNDVSLLGKLFVDVASVKMASERLMKHHLDGKTSYLCTHPIFGPESAADGVRGHTLVVTASSDDQNAARVLGMLEKLGLHIEFMSSEEHDRDMAYSHALTFAVGRALNAMQLDNVGLVTPSFQRLLDIAAIDEKHSKELTETIIGGNPFSDEVLQVFQSSLRKVQEDAHRNKT